MENALSRGQNFERPFLQGRDLYLNFAVFSILYDLHKMIACISFYKSSKKYCDMFHMIRGLLAIEVEQSKQVTFLTPKNCRERRAKLVLRTRELQVFNAKRFPFFLRIWSKFFLRYFW